MNKYLFLLEKINPIVVSLPYYNDPSGILF